MKKSCYLFLLTIVLSVSLQHEKTNAQTIELLGGNLLNGTVTGSILGAATMGLRNSSNFDPLRIGFGAGILGGAGIAIYDVVTLPKGQQFFISGTFNDGSNTSIILLLDTFYGTAGGAAIGTAVIILSGNSFSDGVRLGSSIGAWTGFAFGLADAFFMAERNRDLTSSWLLNRNSIFTSRGSRTEFGLIQPQLQSTPYLTSNGDIISKVSPALGVFSFKLEF
ncbi:MAG: hypothetical protein ACFCU6_00880 [Balneolaceae bacterium]